VAAAWQDSSPVLFIAGQVKSADSSTIQGLPLRQNGTFEFDTTKSFAPISKRVSVIGSAATARQEIERAIRVAQEGRPGPVVLEIPLDVQGALIDETPFAAPAEAGPPPSATQAGAALAEALRGAERPLVLVGIGAVRAGVDVALTEALDAHGVPYIVTQFARQAGGRDHSRYLGSPGIKANRSANLALMSSDLLIVIGSSLHQQVIGWDAAQFIKAPSHKIWFEPDPDTFAARKDLVDEAFLLPVQAAGKALLAALDEAPDRTGKWSDWRDQCASWRSKYLLHYPAHAPVDGRMCLYRAITALDRHADAFGTAVTDAGIAWYALPQHYFPPRDTYFLSSGSFGAMGMALPMAIGAAAATRRPVLALTGDGSIMMCLSELATLKSYHLPVLLVINNNDGYVSIRSTHDRYFEGRKIGTDGSNGVFIPEFRSVAATFEIPYRAAHSEAELDTVLDDLLAAGLTGPVLLEVFTYVDQAVEPVVTSRRDAEGRFTSPSLADMDPAVEENHG
jgi:acetolactate synthase-1/2/3 large subunit